jgi:hypothetical protein
MRVRGGGTQDRSWHFECYKYSPLGYIYERPINTSDVPMGTIARLCYSYLMAQKQILANIANKKIKKYDSL